MLILPPHHNGPEMTDDQHRAESKEIVKEALKEWLDHKFAAFGKWSLGAIAASALVAIVYFIFWLELKK